MATPANEGGIGGKFRRRPLRRTPATPYDRPPAAVRGGGGERGGWVSKIVDSSSRMVSSAASKLFSSMFQKRLKAPPNPTEEDLRSIREVSPRARMNIDRDGHSHTNNSDSGGTGEKDGNDHTNGGGTGERDRNNHMNNSDDSGIVQLEQLLKQKTFTRAEFAHLEQLLRSRTVEPLKSDPEISYEKKEKDCVFAQENGIGSSRAEKSSVPAGSLIIRKQIPTDEAASPAELAKAYIGSRPSKIYSSAVSLKREIFQGDTSSPRISSISNRLDLSVAPRSVIRFSGIPEHPELGRQTPRPLGRSAIYRMSRSPYFKANSMTKVQVGELSKNANASSASHWTPRSAWQTGGKQVSKRGSSVLEDDYESSGPIRRIRQKSNLLSPSKYAHSPHGFKDANKGSLYSQKPLQLHGAQDGIASASSVPPKSSETAQNLFLQLDKLFPSPKEKSSYPKPIFKDELPSKLTLNMLHGSALRSLEDIDSSKFSTMQGSGKSDIASTSHTSNVDMTHPGNFDTVKDNGSSKPAILDKLTFEASGVSNPPVSTKGTKSVPIPKRPAFQITAPEDLLYLGDDDDDNNRDVSLPSTTGHDGTESTMHKDKNVIAEIKTSEKPLVSSSHSMSVSNSTAAREGDKKAPIKPIFTKKESSFAFPISADSSLQSQPPPTPTMPTPQLHRPDTQNVQTSPGFGFATKGASSSTFSSTPIGVNDNSLTKPTEGSPAFGFATNSASSSPFSSTTIGASDNLSTKPSEGLKSEANLSASANATSAEVSVLSKDDQKQETENSYEPSGDTLFTGISTPSTPPIFSFGASTATNLSNGSLHSASTAFPFPNSSATTLSGGPTSVVYYNPDTSSSRTSSTSSAPVISAESPFQTGLGSVSAPLDKSDSSILESKTVNSSPFPTSAVFPSTRSTSSPDIIAFTNISNANSSSSISASVMTATASSSSVLAPSVLAPSPLLSSTAGSCSSAPSSIFSSTLSSGFGFGASVQSSSQNSAANIFGASGGTTTSSPFFSDSSTQASSATTFGATGGSIFGAQSTQSGSGDMSQSSASQFGSVSSAPSFGLGNSSSVSAGVSPFGSTPSSGFSFSASSGSSNTNSSSSFAPVVTNGLFGSTSQTSTSPAFSSAGSSSTNTNSSSSLFGFSSQPSTSPFFSSSSSSTSQSSGFSFGSSSQPSTSPFFPSTASSSMSAPSSGTAPFTFGSSSASSGPMFSFTSAGPTASSISSLVPAFGFGSISPGNNDHMSVEDSMTDDTTNNQAAVSFPTFGQPPNAPPPHNFVFGSQPVQPSGPFQFSGHQNPSVPHNPSPFQAAGNVEFAAGGSFSLGSGGGEKSGRRVVKVKRDKGRKK